MAGKLFKLFTKAQHEAVLKRFSNDADAACAYQHILDVGHIPVEGESYPTESCVSRQLVAYWRKISEHQFKLAAVNRELSNARELVKPSPSDDVGNTVLPSVCRRILHIPDIHAPYNHPDTLAFLAWVKAKYDPDAVVNAGDETDGHGISFHDSDPNLDSAGVELEKAKVFLEELHKLFPDMLICDSNHGSLIYRRAKAHGIPVQFIKRYRDILFPEHGAPGWSWGDAWVLNTPQGHVMFRHQCSGDILTAAAHEGMSLVCGHFHGRFSVQYGASSTRLYYGAFGGCLIDKDGLAFAYGKNFKDKPIIGCMLIEDGVPRLIPMHLDSTGRWIGANK